MFATIFRSRFARRRPAREGRDDGIFVLFPAPPLSRRATNTPSIAAKTRYEKFCHSERSDRALTRAEVSPDGMDSCFAQNDKMSSFSSFHPVCPKASWHGRALARSPHREKRDGIEYHRPPTGVPSGRASQSSTQSCAYLRRYYDARFGSRADPQWYHSTAAGHAPSSGRSIPWNPSPRPIFALS